MSPICHAYYKIDLYSIGFILYIIGYVFISLLSDHDKYKLYSTFCGAVAVEKSKIPGFFQEQCLPQILSILVFS